MSSGKVYLGLLAGVAAGTLSGVLLAPDKGSITRKRISRKGEAFAEDIKEKFNEFLDSTAEKFKTEKDEV
jgi:gas vesicle protein